MRAERNVLILCPKNAARSRMEEIGIPLTGQRSRSARAERECPKLSPREARQCSWPDPDPIVGLIGGRA